jgi:hypothetical protein
MVKLSAQGGAVIMKMRNDKTGTLSLRKDKTKIKRLGNNWTEITTPHLDRHNDYLQIYTKKEGDGYIITDDGYVISDLIESGCVLDTPRQQELLNATLAGQGVKLENGALVISATADNFPAKKHNLVQAMLAALERLSG